MHYVAGEEFGTFKEQATPPPLFLSMLQNKLH